MSEKEFNEIKSTIENAQKSGTLNVNDTTLQSHGKCMGMDTFSWLNPNISVLEKTIDTFPFSTIWLGNYAEIQEFISVQEQNYNKVEQFILYGRCEDIVKTRNKITHFSNLTEALESLAFFSINPGILIFTTSDSDSPYSMKVFNEYIIKIQKNK